MLSAPLSESGSISQRPRLRDDAPRAARRNAYVELVAWGRRKPGKASARMSVFVK